MPEHTGPEIENQRYKNRLIAVPEIYLLEAKARIGSMLPGEMQFAGSKTVVVDEVSNGLLIDTIEHIQKPVKSPYERHSRPALLKTLYVVGGIEFEGFLVDYRYVVPEMRRRSDEETPDPENCDEWTQFRSEHPLGVMFLIEGESVYSGHGVCKQDTKEFCNAIDVYYAALEQYSDVDIAKQYYESYMKNSLDMLK